MLSLQITPYAVSSINEEVDTSHTRITRSPSEEYGFELGSSRSAVAMKYVDFAPILKTDYLVSASLKNFMLIASLCLIQADWE